jgi:hypothetical protein
MCEHDWIITPKTNSTYTKFLLANGSFKYVLTKHERLYVCAICHRTKAIEEHNEKLNVLESEHES